MSDRDELVATVKATLNELDSAIDELEMKSRHAKAEAAQKYKGQIRELSRKREHVQEKLNEIQGVTDDAWEALREGAEAAWTKMKSTIQETQKAFYEGLEGR